MKYATDCKHSMVQQPTTNRTRAPVKIFSKMVFKLQNKIIVVFIFMNVYIHTIITMCSKFSSYFCVYHCGNETRENLDHMKISCYNIARYFLLRESKIVNVTIIMQKVLIMHRSPRERNPQAQGILIHTSSYTVYRRIAKTGTNAYFWNRSYWVPTFMGCVYLRANLHQKYVHIQNVGVNL